MAPRLRKVMKGEQVTRVRPPRELRAKHVFTFALEDGGPAFGMVDLDGIVYMLGVNGWLACNMMEDLTNDSTV